MSRAWLHVETFVRDALRQGFVSTDGAVPLPYVGRAAYLRTEYDIAGAAAAIRAARLPDSLAERLEYGQ